MTSLVSEFLINPVLRQARRFSSGFTTDEPRADPDLLNSPAAVAQRAAGREEAIYETDQDARPRQPSIVPMASLDHPPLDPSPDLPVPSPATSTGADAYTPNLPGWPQSSAHTLVADDELVLSTVGGENTAPRDDRPRSALPEDDGMSVLRQRILAIQARDLAAEQKAVLMHHLLIEGYTKSQLTSQVKMGLQPELSTSQAHSAERLGLPAALQQLWHSLSDTPGPLKMSLTKEDLEPTYAPAPKDDFVERIDENNSTEKHLGCEHYRRNVKLQCFVCERWYTCRLCHDEAETHILPRYATRNMLCMFCGCAQKAGDTCVRCGQSAAYYYCNTCKLWNDNPNKPIYHCNDCGICRIGQGLGKDFFHCSRCAACIPISMEGGQHKCIERAIDSNCPICGEHMFSSRTKVIFMNCGHAIHRPCWDEHMKTSYKCPICNKSCVNMETQFRNLDIMIVHQPMPPEYRDTRAIISCNDCSAKSQTGYHWLGLKCTICQSYNTVQQQLLNLPGEEPAPNERAGLIDDTDQATPGTATPGATATLPLQHTPAPGVLAQDPLHPLPQAAGVTLLNGIPVAAMGTDESDAEEDDMLDFWGREEGRNLTSAESAHAGSEGDSDSADDCDEGEEDDDDDDDDDDDPIALLGHR